VLSMCIVILVWFILSEKIIDVRLWWIEVDWVMFRFMVELWVGIIDCLVRKRWFGVLICR